jgi:hypothetical protein
MIRIAALKTMGSLELEGNIMAKRIQAVSAYRPKLEKVRTVSTIELSEYIAGRTGLNRGEISNVLSEMNEAIIFFNRQGISVKLDGLGTFWPTIQLDGMLRTNLRKDVSFVKALNVVGAFSGDIINRRNIGKSMDDLVTMWNEEHPDDPVED